MRNISFPSSMESYLEDYASFVFCPEGTDKMHQNAVTKYSRARAFIKYMMVGWESTNYWMWEFLLNTNHLKAYPAVLRKIRMGPPTIILYLGHVISFMEYFRDTPPRYCRLGGRRSILVFRDLKKLYKDVRRTVLGHQTLIKQNKQGRLVAKESLATCQRLAKAKIPSLLDDIEKAPPKDTKTRYWVLRVLGGLSPLHLRAQDRSRQKHEGEGGERVPGR
ncbi:uncharacterized protein LOC117808526 [Notolabrus celidotus]|uniref:uncharacterized protein LOC117808526 n=1 Tax=Notolabrus celidotus TaxID=1203425 RepID=UPI00148F641A|nr:uncharacterized protein LOC117808526 [Notolabrus celidotus]